jgi:hypothetical protein
MLGVLGTLLTADVAGRLGHAQKQSFNLWPEGLHRGSTLRDAYAPGDVVVVVGAGTVVAVAPGTVVVVAPGTVVVVVGVPKAGLGAGAVNDGGLDGVGVFTPPIGLVKM